jgi:hypothetical protein
VGGERDLRKTGHDQFGRDFRQPQCSPPVIARTETPLPLSIGLFGAWGSGKSYFMGLLRDRVKALAASASTDYHHDIVQIGFNAWSYADSTKSSGS